MTKLFLLLIGICFTISGFAIFIGNIFYVPENWPQPVYDFSKNPLTYEKVELGRALFYDPLLSKDNSISCNSCHSQFTAFAHVDHALSHGIDNLIGTRNAPALMNLAWQKSFMWDGAINHLDMQPLAPIANEKEMASNIDSVVKKLQRTKLYPTLFLKAFGDSIITGEHTLKAISQFMLTLISNNSKYDSVMRKQATFTQQEKKGYKLFKINCSGCHLEPLFTNQQFENNGLYVDATLNDIGRMKITLAPNDSLKFKVPSLRNIEFSYPYMHDGRFKKLSDVLNHYTSGIYQSKTLSKKLETPILLSSYDKVDIISFLLTLTDRNFLFKTDYSFPKELLLKQ